MFGRNNRKPYRAMIGAGLAAAALAVALSGCKSNVKAAAVPPAPLVTVAQVEPQDVPIYAGFAAQTYARDTVEVRGRVSGYIEKWLFNPGAQVQAGQVLYMLDRRPYQASETQAQGNLRQSKADLLFARQQVSLLQAQANLATAEAARLKAQQDYDRLKPLVAADAASQQDLDAAIANLKAADANLASAKANVQQVDLSTRTQIQSNEGKVESLEGALRNAHHAAMPGVDVDGVGGLVDRLHLLPRKGDLAQSVLDGDPFGGQLHLHPNRRVVADRLAEELPVQRHALVGLRLEDVEARIDLGDVNLAVGEDRRALAVAAVIEPPELLARRSVEAVHVGDLVAHVHPALVDDRRAELGLEAVDLPD